MKGDSGKFILLAIYSLFYPCVTTVTAQYNFLNCPSLCSVIRSLSTACLGDQNLNGIYPSTHLITTRIKGTKLQGIHLEFL